MCYHCATAPPPPPLNITLNDISLIGITYFLPIIENYFPFFIGTICLESLSGQVIYFQESSYLFSGVTYFNFKLVLDV